MRRVSNTRLFASLGSLIYAFSGVPAYSHLAEEVSVPEPTHLHVVATAAGSELVSSIVLGGIESTDASAEVSAIEIRGLNGDRVRGVMVTLENSTSSDQIYVPDSLLSSFRDELQHLEFTRRFDSGCQAIYRCIRGIARCRPSQTERQAYCPGRYSTPDSEGGLVLSTPRSSFSFPSVEASELDALIGEAIQCFD